MVIRLALAALLILRAASSVAAERDPCAGAPPSTTADYLGSSVGVGVRTLDLEDRSRATPPHRGLPGTATRRIEVEVWYPIAAGPDAPVRDATPAGGRFPLVVNSPGLLDGRLGEAYYTAHLASRGFVVASLDFPLTRGDAPGGPDISDFHNQPGDVSFVIDELLRLARRPGSPVGRLDHRRIGVTGLSLGGGTTLLVTYHPRLRDRRVRAALPVAPAACFLGERFYRHARPPLLVLQGDQDLLVPLPMNGARVFDRSRSPRELVTLVHGTHTAFASVLTGSATQSYDGIGCMAIATVPQLTSVVDGLGGARAGIDGTGCALPCQDPPPDNPPMSADEQHRLAKVVEAAFFDATLRDMPAARCFLARGLADENADVRVAVHPKGR
jgi:dienelactone hydrolase